MGHADHARGGVAVEATVPRLTRTSAPDIEAEAGAITNENSTAIPRIVVLMATYRGERFLEPQIASILDQRGVDVRLIVSDDGSDDRTPELLDRIAANDSRVTVLPPERSGSSAGNFFRAIRDARIDDADAIAFSDQDDLWYPEKLARHFALLNGTTAAGTVGGVSSNVAPFSAARPGPALERGGPQRLADHVFDSAGPGSTYLLTPAAYALVREQLLDPDGAASHAAYHDWLIYALVRAAGYRWVFDPRPSLGYRQHDQNVLGAQSGFAQDWERLRVIASKAHRAQVITIAHAALRVAEPRQRPRLEWLLERMEHPGPLSNLRLAAHAGQYRRSLRDRLALGATMGLGIW